MIPQRVTLITLGTADLSRAKAFYGRLGWQPVQEQEGVAFYQLNGMGLGLFGHDALAADQGRPGAKLGTGAMTLAQNFVTRAEVDAAYAAALEAGGTGLKAPEAVFWGGYSGYWADLDGHVWEVAMNPFWPLGSDGSLTLPPQDAPAATPEPE
ncbi:MAG: glyoxalase [Confluentimicrobium sp.]|nr:glyoxalase [Actibacterium sp.]MBF54229.1 glyoxalase [Actibacterium sp.]OWU70276.1 glyoxalase [Roseovarius sp. 22II1-1F6A]